MMNDHAWMQLHAHRESEHRARARRRGGDDTPAGSARPSPTQWLRLARRTASAAPTAAALAWARLASGTGTLEPATPTTTELERDAA